MVNMEEIEAEELKKKKKSDSISNYLEKKKRIKKEVARLKRLFKEIDDNKKKLVFTTIDDVAFMTITMQDLRDVPQGGEFQIHAGDVLTALAKEYVEKFGIRIVEE